MTGLRDGQMERPALERFARILDYPRTDLVEDVQACKVLVAPNSSAAAALLEQFRDFAADAPLTLMEEIYTATFDLYAICYPYVGHYLFGESHKRSIFMLELKARFREQGFDAGHELPDHLPILLSFLAVCRDPGQAEEIIRDAVLPALHQMTRQSDEANTAPDANGRTGSRDNHRPAEPYGWVLDALRLTLEWSLTEPSPARAARPEV